jgi:transcription elongation factor/antiterminator RfaH
MNSAVSENLTAGRGTVPPPFNLTTEVDECARWYVVQTLPHSERKALFHLERQEYVTFLPRNSKLVRHARKSTTVLAPLFPNYLFVHMDISLQRWRPINGTFGVARLITQNDFPKPVPIGVIEAIQSHANGDGTCNLSPSLKLSQNVRINDGPFADFIGTLEQLDASGRVRVLLDLMGREVSISARAEILVTAV